MDIVEINPKFWEKMVRIEHGRANDPLVNEVEGFFPTSYAQMIGNADIDYRYVCISYAPVFILEESNIRG